MENYRKLLHCSLCLPPIFSCLLQFPTPPPPPLPSFCLSWLALTVWLIRTWLHWPRSPALRSLFSGSPH